MFINRKRKRAALPVSSADEYGEVDPPPFAPAQLSLFKSYRAPLSRSVTSGLSPLILNLVLMAGQRLKARDFKSAAAVLPALLKRYRKVKTHRWYFSREIAVTGAEVLRRSGVQYAQLLDEFLSHIARDGHLSANTSLEGYSSRTRECVLLERVMELLVTGDLPKAFEYMQNEHKDEIYSTSALVHGFFGILALAVSAKEADPSFMLATASESLSKASRLEPKAYFYTYYAAAASIAAADSAKALHLLRDFVNNKHRKDPVALYGLLTCLSSLTTHTSTEIRQERIEIARRLLCIDPVSKPALDILREANAWQWQVSPVVLLYEIAEALASRIEHGESANVATWTELCHVLHKVDGRYQQSFWLSSQRSQWWPTHFFRVSRVNTDIANNPNLASVKGTASKLLRSPEHCPYAQAVESSGAVDLYWIGSDQ